MTGEHRMRLSFTCPNTRASASRARRNSLSRGGRNGTLDLDSQLTATMREGSETPIGGWVSRGYHRKAAAVTIEASMTGRGRSPFVRAC